MRTYRVIVSMVAALFLALHLAEADEPRTPDTAKAVRAILEKVDELRAEAHAPALRIEPKIEKCVEEFAAFMARTDDFGHEADGRRPADRAKAHEYEYCLLSENIAYQLSSEGFATAELAARLFIGWKDSPGHLSNMLDPDAVDTGLAIARSPKSGKYYAVQMFGRPRSAAFKFGIENRTMETVKYRVGEDAFTIDARSTRTHELCRPEPLRLDLGETSKAVQPLRPAAGDAFVIENVEGSVRVRRATATLKKEPSP